MKDNNSFNIHTGTIPPWDRKIMNELVATYHYCPINHNGEIRVYACYDSDLDMQNRNVDFYDIYNKNGVCLNEGDPFYHFPTWQEVFDDYYQKV